MSTTTVKLTKAFWNGEYNVRILKFKSRTLTLCIDSASICEARTKLDIEDLLNHVYEKIKNKRRVTIYIDRGKIYYRHGKSKKIRLRNLWICSSCGKIITKEYITWCRTCELPMHEYKVVEYSFCEWTDELGEPACIEHRDYA